MRILVIRPDRLGDVILSTPVFDVIKRHYPDCHLTVMLKEEVSPVIRGISCVDEILHYDPEGRHAGFRGFFRLISDIRARKPKIAIVLQSHWKIAAALFFAKTQHRIGPYSKIHSYLFYNRGIRQRRSSVEMHETDYNLQLLRRLGIRVGTRNIPTQVHVSEESKKWAKEWLTQQGWSEGTPLLVVHPGMGGSALNWPENHYLDLIRLLLKEGRNVLVTTGPMEDALLRRFQESFKATPPFFYGGAGASSIDRLAGLYFWSTLVIAPSTGPLHLAVALGRAVVTFYPPIRVQSAIRWGPYLSDESRSSVLVPEVYCGQDFKCRGSLCNYFPCMKSLTVTETMEKVTSHLNRS